MIGLVLLVAACSSGADGDEEASSTPTPRPSATPATVDEAEEPAEVVLLARGDWESGWFQAEIHAQLIRQLGYNVADPTSSELSPELFYASVARGDVDLWANGWFPHHDLYLESESASGSSIGDAVTIVGEQINGAGVLGFAVNRDWALVNNIRYIDDISQNSGLSAQVDISGNRIGDIIGCDQDWACRETVDELIDANGWNLEQVSGDYDELFTAAVDRVDDGTPTLVFMWGPSEYVNELTPGENVAWLGMRNPPDGLEPARLDDDECLADPCTIGFLNSDIRTVANTEWLDDHPDIAALLEVIEIPKADVAAQNALMAAGEDSDADVERHATDWVVENRDLIEEWLDS